MKKYSLSALVAAGLLAGAATSASAADLGGNCCADLEERIAELEATTARKGNRKVSLTISGWVAEQITFWDDKHERNQYVTGIGGTLATNVKFTGSAKISSDHSAGYVLYLEANTVDSLLGVNQNKDDGGSGISVRESYWYLKSNSMGQVSVGLRSTATDNLAILTDGSGSLVQANWVLFEGAGFFLRNAANTTQTNFIWGSGLHCYTVGTALNTNGAGIGGDCTGAPMNSIRYDSPTFAGFSASAAFGEDDFWDVALRYAGEHHGFKVAFAVGYSQATDQNGLPATDALAGSRVDQIQLGGYIQHIGTGLFVHGAWLRENLNGVRAGTAAASPAESAAGVATAISAAQASFMNGLDPEMWYIKAGIRAKHFSLGHTVFYGEYAEANDKMSPLAIANGVTSSKVNWWGLGLVQEIDAAAMSVWIKYRNVDGDFTAGGVKTGVDNLQMVTVGGLINF